MNKRKQRKLMRALAEETEEKNRLRIVELIQDDLEFIRKNQDSNDPAIRTAVEERRQRVLKYINDLQAIADIDSKKESLGSKVLKGVGVVIPIVTTALGIISFNHSMNKGLRFEETGTLSSNVNKNLWASMFKKK